MRTTVPLVTRPSLASFGFEPLRAAFEFMSFRLSRRETRPGDGHRVLIYPGLGTDGGIVEPLHRHCRDLGFRPLDWGRGTNTGPKGDPADWLSSLAVDADGLLGDDTESATLLGWSLGGLYAREVAKLIPGRIRQVITIGTPFNAAADYTNVGWLFRLLNGTSPDIDPVLAERLRTPPPVPTTSIYSVDDGIVAWQTCRHHKRYRQVEDVEVQGSHIGMGWNPQVHAIVADRLAQRPGRWKRHRAQDAASRTA